MLALPIFAASHPPSIVGVHELNFCVRDGREPERCRWQNKRGRSECRGRYNRGKAQARRFYRAPQTARWTRPPVPTI